MHSEIFRVLQVQIKFKAFWGWCDILFKAIILDFFHHLNLLKPVHLRNSGKDGNKTNSKCGGFNKVRRLMKSKIIALHNNTNIGDLRSSQQ
jgi:hypothetical protein